ncbi:MarR family winged helix-turn-helix transcriptional regulator [Georgenia sp. SUBG003]|uniref:MarR family winged helix-turn-helix transcriptional regulator n=1 Tax=Georgenia sp. SUBG003 TaxID=1497974 RepID=UPI003AB72C7A
MTHAATDPGPHVDVDLAARRARSAVRRAEPGNDLVETLALADQMTAMVRSQEQISRAIERLTGLRLGEMQALEAVARGADHPRAVARRTGQADAAAEATCQGLLARGLLARHHHPLSRGGRPRLIHVTEAGRVALEQVEALHLRLFDVVVDSLEEIDPDQMRATVRRIADALDPAQVGARRPELAPAVLTDGS